MGGGGGSLSQESPPDLDPDPWWGGTRRCLPGPQTWDRPGWVPSVHRGSSAIPPPAGLVHIGEAEGRRGLLLSCPLSVPVAELPTRQHRGNRSVEVSAHKGPGWGPCSRPHGRGCSRDSPSRVPPQLPLPKMDWRPWCQKGSRATGRPPVQVRGAVGGAPSPGCRTVTPLAPSPSVREDGTLMVTLAGRFQEASHLCTHTQGQGWGALGTNQDKHRFPPCLPPRETSPGPLFLGCQQPLPQIWPSSRPGEPNSEGAVSSPGVLRPGLAWAISILGQPPRSPRVEATWDSWKHE